MSLTMHGFTKSTSQIYRDCLRLINHIGGKSSAKTIRIQGIVRNEFKKNAKIEDAETIERLKSNAVRGLSNYLLMENMMKDERFKQQSQSYIQREIASAKSADTSSQEPSK